MSEKDPKGCKRADILRFAGGIAAWLLLLAASFGAGVGIAYLAHLIFD